MFTHPLDMRILQEQFIKHFDRPIHTLCVYTYTIIIHTSKYCFVFKIVKLDTMHLHSNCSRLGEKERQNFETWVKMVRDLLVWVPNHTQIHISACQYRHSHSSRSWQSAATPTHSTSASVIPSSGCFLWRFLISSIARWQLLHMKNWDPFEI